MKMLNLASQKERGFTLVELAIVLIIIGLLIGGTLKGQELINGARVTATTAQIKALEAGTLTFLDTYNGFPGDLANAATRLPNCSAAAGTYQCAMSGNPSAGNGRVDVSPQSALSPMSGAGNAAAANESFAFFNHLFNADLLDGIDGTATVTVGTGVLGAKLGSAKHYRVGYMSSGTASIEANNGTSVLNHGPAIRPGHYLYMTSMAPATDVVDTGEIYNLSLTPSEASRIDAKYDDGAPNTGNAIGVGSVGAGANQCRSGSATSDVYVTSNRQNDCGLYVRFSN